MRRSAWGTENGGAMMTFAIGFTDHLSCNSYLQFFCVSCFQIPDEEECLWDRKWWCFLLSFMMTFAIGFTNNLSCNYYLQFFYVFYFQIPDEEE